MADISKVNRSVSEKHKIAISDVPQEQKKAAYDSWGPSYDEDMWIEPIYSWKIGAEMMLEIINANSKAGSVPIVVDAGCGTGGPGGILRKLANEQDRQIRLIGYDFSQSMLEQAQSKGFYDELFIGDLLSEVPLKEQTVDYVMSFGVFVDGSDHPEALAKVLSHIRKGGMAVITFRLNTFERMKMAYKKVMEKVGCTIVKKKIDKYYGTDNALYVIFKKSGGPEGPEQL